MDSIAIISDIHGNIWALEAVLDDIQRRGITRIINLGDSLYGPLMPFQTYKLLLASEAISISGNEDRIICDNYARQCKNPILEYLFSELNGDVVSWLANLPSYYIYNNQIYCCHGSPGYDSFYLLEKVGNGIVSIRDEEEIIDSLSGIEQGLVACAHSHVPKMVRVNGTYILNAGSVGLQAYTDDVPESHAMQNYNPYPSYLNLSIDSGEVMVAEIIRVHYNFEKAAKTAERNHRKDWARWLRTGKVY